MTEFNDGSILEVYPKNIQWVLGISKSKNIKKLMLNNKKKIYVYIKISQN